MPDRRNKGLVPEVRRGTSDQDSQDSKSHNSQKQVASDDDGGNGVDGVRSSSSGSSSQSSSTSPDPDELPGSASSLQPDEPVNMGQGSSASNEETLSTETSEDAAVSGSNQQLTISLFDSTTHSDRTPDQLVGEGLERATGSGFSPVNSLGPIRRGPANGQYAGSDLPAAEDLILVEEDMDHTTITAEGQYAGSDLPAAEDLILVEEDMDHTTITAEGQYAGSDLPAAEDLILVEEDMDHTTITAEASRNIGVAAKAKDLNTSSLTSDKMKKLEPMAELPPINGNFYPDGGPGIQGANINNGMLMQSSWNGDMFGSSKQPIWVIASPVLNLSPSGGINPFGDVYVSKDDDVLMALFYGEDVPQEL